MAGDSKNQTDSEPVAVLDLGSHRDALYRYALLHLRDSTAADDVVQATFLAALQAGAKFRGESSPRTWLIGILKRKIIDHFRARARDQVAPEAAANFADEHSEAEFLDRLFDRDGTWTMPPGNWADPHRALEEEGFWRVLELCLEHLPGMTGRVFMLREVIGLEPVEICKDLRLSKSNYWVMMHRARLRLRDCLEKNWFAER